jgi:hypothetical protein
VTKMGPEYMDEIGEDPTVDSFFDANPRTKNIDEVIRFFRRKRAEQIDTKGKGRAKTGAAQEASDE